MQVIDVEPFALDMVLPAYLPASDLTQRVARDAGLGAYFEDGSRRTYYLRARGRLLRPEEKLQDLGIVPDELLHLLPEPAQGEGLRERPPEYPPPQGSRAAGSIQALGWAVVLLAWTGAWALALTVQQGVIDGLLPGVGLSLLCTTFSRHLWGGSGSAIRIPLTALPVYFGLMVVAAAPALIVGAPLAALALALGSAFIGGSMGVLLGWLAWYGAVEPLPAVQLQEVKKAEALVTWPCGVCGAAVTADVKAECQFGCGRVFHQGCYAARNALAPGGDCAICGFTPGASATTG